VIRPGLLPLAPVELEPGYWPSMMLYAATVFLEAEGEPEPGQVAVAWVIRTRMDQQRASPRLVILGVDELAGDDGKPYEAFSCWNDDYVEARRRRLLQPEPNAWETAWRAASAAYWRLIPDPTHGASFYLNEELTRQIRPDHQLPSWFKRENVRCKIGRHTFLL